MSERPEFQMITTGAEFRRWYWRKDELIEAARFYELKTTGGKFQILDRIAHFLDTGEKVFPADQVPKPTSTFNWSKEPLTRETIITDNYRNSQNVRAFFKEHAYPAFKFHTELMDWMRANVGRTLGDACEAHLAMRAQQKTPGFQSEIKSHNQFNQYTRDFLAANPMLGMADVRRIWSLKIKRPSEDGRHVYQSSDLDLT